jgi:hypothetical protein
MFDLPIPPELVKFVERVARKVFATIRYRFSHLDNGLLWTTAASQTARSTKVFNLLKTLWLVKNLAVQWKTGVPVVVAD